MCDEDDSKENMKNIVKFTFVYIVYKIPIYVNKCLHVYIVEFLHLLPCGAVCLCTAMVHMSFVLVMNVRGLVGGCLLC